MCAIRFWNLWCSRMFSTLQLDLVYISCFSIQIFCSDFQMCVYVCVFGCYFFETRSYCIAQVSLLSWVTLTSTCGMLGTQASHVFVKNYMPPQKTFVILKWLKIGKRIVLTWSNNSSFIQFLNILPHFLYNFYCIHYYFSNYWKVSRFTKALVLFSEVWDFLLK